MNVKPSLRQRLRCWFQGHKFHVDKEFSPWSRRLRCDCCGERYAMNDNLGVCVRWHDDFEDMYRRLGWWDKPSNDGSIKVMAGGGK